MIQKSGDAENYFNAESVIIERSIFQELGNERDDSRIISDSGLNVEFSNSVLYNNTGFRIGGSLDKEDSNITFRNLLVLENNFSGKSFFLRSLFCEQSY